MNGWEDITDPEGRLCKGMLVRWKHSPGGPFMRVLALCAPSGLYRRPVVPGEKYEDMAVEGRMVCDKDHPEAIYDPWSLMIKFRYLPDGGTTTGRAPDIEQVPNEMIEKSNAWREYDVPEDAGS